MSLTTDEIARLHKALFLQHRQNFLSIRHTPIMDKT